MNVLSVLILIVFVIVFGKDPMELNSQVNQQLDAAIANKVLALKSQPKATKEANRVFYNIEKIDSDIKAFWTSIKIYDACTRTCRNADLYFDEWAQKLNLDKQAFIKLSEQGQKPDSIVAIKKNELKLLDEIALRQ